jgi:hypothetical protein
MENAITILKDLWRCRVLVAAFCLVSVLIGIFVAFEPGFPPESRARHVGEGHLQILVDTPASQVVEVETEGSTSLGSRASLIANLMVAGEVKQAIARSAKLPPQQMIAISEAAVAPSTPPPAQLNDPRAYVLKTSVVSNEDGVQLPIIAVDTQAPDANSAAALANAAAAGLKEYLDARATNTRVPDAKRLQVRSLGVAQARDVVKGPGMLLAAFVAIFIFGTLCGALLLAIRTLVTARHLQRRDAFAQDWHVAETHDEPAPVQPFHDSRHEEPYAREHAPPAPVVPLAPAAIPPPAQSRGAELGDARV